MVPDGVHNYAYCLGSSLSFKKFYACTCGRGLFQGSVNENDQITSVVTGNAVLADEVNEYSYPSNAKEAKQLILSGEYNHQH